MVDDADYFLTIGEGNRERLHKLNTLCNPATQNFLLKNGLAAGMRVLDIGCGTGLMTRWLAE